MKTHYTLLLLLLPALLCCNKPAETQEPDNKDPQEQTEDPNKQEDPNKEDPNQEDPNQEDPNKEDPNNQDPDPVTDPWEGVDTEVKDGDVILVTNAYVEKFLTEVSYPDHDYTETHILDRDDEGNKVYGPTSPGKNSDKPNSFTIRWTADASAGATVKINLWEETWSREYEKDATQVGEDGWYVGITNLRPNAHYNYTVTSAAGNVLTQGSFTTTGHLHQLFFKTNVRNCRDLGGWKTTDGKMVRYRMVYRGGRTEGITTAARKELQAEGIRGELELREVGDDAVSENQFMSSGDNPDDYPFLAPSVPEGYKDMLTTYKDKTLQCVNFVFDCVRNNKPVYFHCSLGRDRTGTMSMLLLGVLGVREGDISQEYELTQFAPSGWSTSGGESQKMTRVANWAYKHAAGYIWDTYATDGKTFKEGVEAFLVDIGVRIEDIEEFRSLMLVD